MMGRSKKGGGRIPIASLLGATSAGKGDQKRTLIGGKKDEDLLNLVASSKVRKLKKES